MTANMIFMKMVIRNHKFTISNELAKVKKKIEKVLLYCYIIYFFIIS